MWVADDEPAVTEDTPAAEEDESEDEQEETTEPVPGDPSAAPPVVDVSVDDEEEDGGRADLYRELVSNHPDTVVETSSLASTISPPSNYELDETVRLAALSDVQLGTVELAFAGSAAASI